jgi:uncharacterized membrane protein
MTALIELAYVVYWFRTFYPALESAEVYKQRLWVTAGMLAVLSVAGHLSSKELGAVVSGWAIAIELASVVLNILNLDDRLFRREA